MKETVKISRVCGYLEKMYRQLNQDKFDGKLEMPVITVMTTPNAYGHVTCGKVWRTKETQRYELNIAAGTLDRPIENVVSTLLHEMVHIYNMMNGIQDCSRGNTYHNKHFKVAAESVGLVIEYDKRIGWSITSPSDELIDYIILQGWEDIEMNRGDGINYRTGGSHGGADGKPTDGTKIRKPSSTRKYICPCCGMSVRATRTVRIKCIECDTEMKVEQ